MKKDGSTKKSRLAEKTLKNQGKIKDLGGISRNQG